jgi:hypothetical protein
LTASLKASDLNHSIALDILNVEMHQCRPGVKLILVEWPVSNAIGETRFALTIMLPPPDFKNPLAQHE